MASATLNIRVPPRRMLSDREAAEYCGMRAATFRANCPVAPVDMPGAGLRYDMRDLDKWLDAFKEGAGDDAEAIVSKLG